MGKTNVPRELLAPGIGALAGVVGAAVAAFLIAERIASWVGRRLT